MKTSEYTYNNQFTPLSLRDLGGVYLLCRNVFFTYRYKAFRRCQTMAQAEGSVRYSYLNLR